VAFADALSSAAQSDALVQSNVVANDRRLADNDPHSMVDEDTVAEACTGMDLDARPKASDLR
jgi:hypothetical protein